MAKMEFVLPLRLLVGLYSRIVRRELGLTFSQMIPVLGGIRNVKSVFARSVAVALGESFASGDFVRWEFADVLPPRLAMYRNDKISRPDVIGRASEMTRIVEEASRIREASYFSAALGMQVDLDDAVAREAASDYQRLLTLARDRADLISEGGLGPLWSAGPPWWWRMWGLEEPDHWVGPLTALCAPVWSSSELSKESLEYLVDFGLNGIESNPNLISPWTDTVAQLVVAASKPRADIKEAVSCCKVEP